MENHIVGFDVTGEFARAKTQLGEDDRYPGWLMDEVQGYAFFILDQDGRVIQWNQGALRLTGYLAEDIIGQDFSCLYDRGEKQMHQTPKFYLNMACRQGFYRTRGWWLRRNAPHFLAEIMIMRIRSNGGGFAVMVWDISKNKVAASEMDERCHKISPLDE